MAVPPAESSVGHWFVAMDATGGWVRYCPNPKCSVERRTRLVLPSGWRLSPSAAPWLRILQVAGQELLHARAALDEAHAFEALVAPLSQGSPPGAEPRVVAALISGPGRGGQAGQALEIRARSRGGHSVVRGALRAGVSLCGRRALLEPELLRAQPWEWVPARYQRLSRSSREAAVSLSLDSVEAPSPHHPGLVAQWSSSGSNPAHLTDSNPATAWVPGGSAGARGAFALLRPPRDLPVEAIELRLSGADNLQPPGRLFLLLDESVYRLSPGELGAGWYRAALPAPVTPACLALVVGRSRAGARVGVAELRLVSELAALSPAALARSIVENAGDRPAWAELELRADEGQSAIAAVFSQLGPGARARARRLLRGAACDVQVPLVAAQLAAGAELRRWEQSLRPCASPLLAALERQCRQSPRDEQVPVGVLDGLVALSPARAARAMAGRLAQEGCVLPAIARAELRGRLLRLGGVGAQAVAGALAQRRDACTQRELLRSHPGASVATPHGGEASVSATGSVGPALERVLASAKGFSAHYRALEVAVRWAETHPGAQAFVTSALGNPDWRLRLRAVELLSSERDASALLRALTDPSVRVRHAAATGLRDEAGRTPVAQALLERLEGDPWPMVRAVAADALARAAQSQLNNHAAVAAALARALRDDSWLVRRAGAQAAARLPPPWLSGPLLSRLEDAAEDPSVRAAAAMALVRRCDHAALGSLTRLSRGLRDPRARRETLELGRVALDALARLAPRDLSVRLQPLLDSRQPAVRRVALRALARTATPCGQRRVPPGIP